MEETGGRYVFFIISVILYFNLTTVIFTSKINYIFGIENITFMLNLLALVNSLG